MNPELHSIWGKAAVDHHGYYRIVTGKEGNNGKSLHRLIYTKFYGEIPKGFVIHHKDGNKLNNCILNLTILRNEDHSRFHSTGKSHPLYGTSPSKEVRSKISHTLSEKYNTSKYYRVHKQIDPTCSQGFIWAYRYYENNKRVKISSVDIHKLKRKVLAKGLPWKEYN